MRGSPYCPQFCISCRNDCKCPGCNYCHNCAYSTKYSHQNRHTCETACGDFSVNFASEIFTVIVGASKKAFHVHKDALSKSSLYFNKLLGSEMSETKENTVTLDSEVDHEGAFQKFVEFAYCNNFSMIKETMPERFTMNARIYLLADRLGCVGLKIDALKKASTICSSLCPELNGVVEISKSDTTGLSGLLACLPEAINFVYTSTYDSHPGKVPKLSVIQDSAGGNGKLVTRQNRDEFRLLIGRLAAACIKPLLRYDPFLEVAINHPEFLADALSFAAAGKVVTLEDNGSGYVSLN